MRLKTKDALISLLVTLVKIDSELIVRLQLLRSRVLKVDTIGDKWYARLLKLQLMAGCINDVSRYELTEQGKEVLARVMK